MSITNELVSELGLEVTKGLSVSAHGLKDKALTTAMPIVGLYLTKVYADSTIGFKKTVFERPTGLDMEIDCSLFEQIATPSDTSDIIFDDEIY